MLAVLPCEKENRKARGVKVERRVGCPDLFCFDLDMKMFDRVRCCADGALPQHSCNKRPPGRDHCCL